MEDHENRTIQIPEEDQYFADPQELPGLTWWPIALAFGVIFFFWGFITSLILTGVGFIVIAVSITGWISDLKTE